MKRILISFFILVFAIVASIVPCGANVYAAVEPEYDENFNSVGAFYANGTPVTITDVDGTTTVTWAGGSKQIKNTTLVFAGGKQGTTYETGSVTMESGTVGSIYGGGYSLESTSPAIVNKSNIIVNGGTVNASVFGGGLLYSQVDDVNVTINNGSISFLVGGGMASYTVSGTPYSTGTEENPKASGTVVKSSNLTVNNGTVEDIFGGGQGYSNTESTTVNINGGTMNYITAGGSNGYTGSAKININGGSTKIYQSTNRGTVNDVNLKMTNGTVDDFYVGGQDAFDVTGTLNTIKTELLGGNVTNLYSGLSGSVPLEVDGKVYDVEYVKGVIQNNYVPNSKEIEDNFNVLLLLAIIIGVIIALIAFVLLVTYVS